MATNNQLLNCPPLRFSEFKDEWKQTTLGEVATFCGGGTPSSQDSSYWDGNIPWISSSDIQSGNISNINITRFISSNALKHSSTKLCKAPCILIVSRVGVGKVAYSEIDICTSQDFCNLTDIQAEYHFLAYLLQPLMERKSVEVQGTSIKGITMDEIRHTVVALPSLPEQEKIASFLSLLDERIEAQRQTISHLSSLSIGVYQCILSKRKERWSKVFLRDVMTIRKEKNSKNAEVHSVSVKRGILNQIEHLGRSFAAKDTKHYSLVYNGDLVYTKSPTGQFPFGIVKQSFIKAEVAVSPLYGIYTPINLHIGRIIHNFFLSPVRASSYLGTLVQKGAKNTMNITTEHFLDNTMYLPSNVKEQEIIAKFLIKLDERIEVEEQLLQKYEEQKRYLLRKMFV